MIQEKRKLPPCRHQTQNRRSKKKRKISRSSLKKDEELEIIKKIRGSSSSMERKRNSRGRTRITRKKLERKVFTQSLFFKLLSNEFYTHQSPLFRKTILTPSPS